jgi:hypothetical protein
MFKVIPNATVPSKKKDEFPFLNQREIGGFLQEEGWGSSVGEGKREGYHGNRQRGNILRG